MMPVIKRLTSGEKVGLEAQFSYNAWHLLRRIDELKHADDVLIRFVSQNGKLFEQVVIPRALQPKILRAFHDDPMGAHLSRDKMLGKIFERYFWL